MAKNTPLEVGGLVLQKYKDIYGQTAYANHDGFMPRVVVLDKPKALVIGTMGYEWGMAKFERQLLNMVQWAVLYLSDFFSGYKIYVTRTGYKPDRVTSKALKEMRRIK